MRLVDKVAIITGGGSGIGKAIAMAFVREGAKVVIAGRDSKKLDAAAAEIGGDCLAVSADVSSAKSVEKLVSAAHDKFKRINILVNNAAVLLPGTAESLSEEYFDQTFDINVRGLWLMSRAVLPHMRGFERWIDCEYRFCAEPCGSAQSRGVCSVKRRCDGHDQGDGAGPCGGKYPRELHLPGNC